MFHSERSRIALLVACLLLTASAASSVEVPAMKPRIVKRSFTPRFEVGFSYLQWSERLSLSQGPNSTEGYATYSGPALIVGATQHWKRWLGELQFSLGKGSAVASGFGPAISFTDAYNRSWFAIFIKPSVRYLLNPYTSVGLGLLVRLRGVDWSPADTSIRVDTAQPLGLGLSLDAQLKIVPHFAIAQSFAPTGLRGEFQWISSAVYVF